eukprot:Pgem_evm1s3433
MYEKILSEKIDVYYKTYKTESKQYCQNTVKTVSKQITDLCNANFQSNTAASNTPTYLPLDVDFRLEISIFKQRQNWEKPIEPELGEAYEWLAYEESSVQSLQIC